jgi:predicted transcriptional regulator
VDDDVQLISDGDGLAVIGEPTAVERFLAANELPKGRDLGLERLKPVAGMAAAAMQAGSVVAENHGRWVKLSEKSTELLKTHAAMKGSLPTLERGVIMDGNKIKGIVEFARGPGAYLTNPAILSGAAGIMAQYAMQQTMDEITDYLAVIDAKVDDILRGQKDAVLADMIGVEMVIDEGTLIRAQVGRVSDITWSKVQGTTQTLARTQGYALRQLDALAEKMERTTKVDDLVKVTKDAESTVREWLAVLARCFQLQDAVAVLELDRVLDASPEELDEHRLALRSVRQNRLAVIGRTTDRLLERMDAAAGTANAKVLLNPFDSRAIVGSSNRAATGVVRFNGLLGVADERESLEARPWLVAVGDAWDAARDQGVEGAAAARRLGAAAFGRGRAAADGLQLKLAEGALRRRRGKGEGASELDAPDDPRA